MPFFRSSSTTSLLQFADQSEKIWTYNWLTAMLHLSTKKFDVNLTLRPFEFALHFHLGRNSAILQPI